jgi:hypothetical protein
LFTDRNNPTSRTGGYGTQDNSYNQRNTSTVPDTTTGRANRRSVAFEDEPRHRDTSPNFSPPQHASNLGNQDFSSVSSVNPSSSGALNTTGDGLHVPPRGSAVRGNSGYAPESISGNVERVPTLPSHRQGDRADTYDEYSSTDENGLKKQGTLSKLFKRKPVSGPESRTIPAHSATGDERKKYF